MAVKNESQQQQHGRLTMHATCFRGVGGFSDGGGSLWSRPKATTIAGVWILLAEFAASRVPSRACGPCSVASQRVRLMQQI